MNINILITGCALLSFGCHLLFNRESYASVLIGEVFYLSNYLLIVAGCLVIIISILGCIAICKNWATLLNAYAWFLFVIFILESTGVLLGYVFSNLLQGHLTDRLRTRMTSYYDTDVEITKTVDALQMKLRCCGASSYHDWDGSPFVNRHKTINNERMKGSLLPTSCCKTIAAGCSRNIHPSNIYAIGCVTFILERLKSNLTIIAAVGLGIAFLEMCGITLACLLVRIIKKEQSSKY